MRYVLWISEFDGDLVYKLKEIVGFNYLLIIKIISYCKKNGYNINVLQQTACMVVNPITYSSFAFILNCMPIGRNSESVMALT